MEFFNKNITYKGISDKGLTLQLIDSEDGKWTIWKKDAKNKDQDSDAFASLQAYKMGDTFGISYGEKENSFIGKEGNPITYTQRTIYSIMPVIDDVAIRTPKAVQKPRTEPPVASQGKQDETFWDKKAYKQCLWNFWLTKVATAENDFHDVWSVFNRIEADADERFSPATETPLYKFKREEVADDIQDMADEMASDNNIDTEGIPF